MAFKLGDIIWDRLQYGYAESLDADAVPLYLLTQLQDTTINVTATSEDKTDAQGNLIKKVWKTKSGTLEGQNALINTNIIAAASGSDPVFATNENKIVMPKIITVKAGASVTLADAVQGSVKVSEFVNGNSLGQTFEVSETADETHFSITTAGILTLPKAENITKYAIKYQRNVTDGVKIQNRIDKFPKAVRLILKGLYFDPCEKNTLRGGYIELPSFQISPEINIPIKTDATMDYKGDLEIDYCADEKVLYNMYLAADDDEDEE